MKMGFYLFAEYANMFISSDFSDFIGGYNYPGMSWVVENWGVNIGNLLGFGAFIYQIVWFIFFLYVGSLDYSKI
jgi:NADH-quinone oxidoreductase subunit H